MIATIIDDLESSIRLCESEIDDWRSVSCNYHSSKYILERLEGRVEAYRECLIRLLKEENDCESKLNMPNQ